MPKYRAAMSVFGLSTGDTFESNDPGWGERATAGFVVKVDDDTPLTVTEEGDKNEEGTGQVAETEEHEKPKRHSRGQ